MQILFCKLFWCSDVIKKIVDAANDNGIDFVYAIAPGLDVVFASEADVLLLKNKLKQVRIFWYGTKIFH